MSDQVRMPATEEELMQTVREGLQAARRVADARVAVEAAAAELRAAQSERCAIAERQRLIEEELVHQEHVSAIERFRGRLT